METANLIGYQYTSSNGKAFKAIDPSSDAELPGDFYSASLTDVDAALNLAEKAFGVYRYIDNKTKATFLRSIADEINAIGDELIERAMAESGSVARPFTRRAWADDRPVKSICRLGRRRLMGGSSDRQCFAG